MNIPLNINWQQILLHLLNFAILAGGLYFLLYSPVKKFMAQRTEHFKDMEDEAKKKTDDAEILKNKYAEELANAEDEARRMKAEAMQSVKAETERQIADAKKQADEIIMDAKLTAQREREKAFNESQKELRKLALDATKKLLQSEGDPVEQFLNAAERGGSHVG